jgi:hypothetical protein
VCQAGRGWNRVSGGDLVALKVPSSKKFQGLSVVTTAAAAQRMMVWAPLSP